MKFSLIVPCYNEAANLPVLLKAATDCFDNDNISYEIIFANDGSTDETMEVLTAAIEEYRANPRSQGRVRVIELSRNFGKEAAMYAGLQAAEGEFVGFIDGDMQQDPMVSLKMLHLLERNEDIDCVAAVPDKRRDSAPVRVCKKTFYRAFSDMCSTPVVADASDYRVFRRSVADALLSLGEHNRFTKGLFSWVGFNTITITYEVHDRLNGSSKWSLRQLFSYAWNGMVAFSTWPLKLIMYLGIVLAVASVVFIGIDVVQRLAVNGVVVNDQLILYMIMLFGGIQMIVLGVVGEYIARMYTEVKARPIYIARRNFAVEPNTVVLDYRPSVVKTGLSAKANAVKAGTVSRAGAAAAASVSGMGHASASETRQEVLKPVAATDSRTA